MGLRILIICFFITNYALAQTTLNTEQNVITGFTDVRLLERGNNYRWYKDGYMNYQPNNSALEVIRNVPYDIQIFVFAGTWCEKSQILLPQFYKAMDLAGFAKQKITLYLLDRDKRSPQGMENNYNINSTPVFIIIQKGVEIGRIAETVSQSIEADIADLIPRK
jgi:thiol-disulfide isomerase/thioredoxin